MKNRITFLVTTLIIINLLLSFTACKKTFKPCLLRSIGIEMDTVTIPFNVYTLLSPRDTVFHLGTFGMFHYWDSLYKVREQPSGYFGYIHFADTAYNKIILGYDPYDLQSIYEIPIHLERSLIPYLKNFDKSFCQGKVLDDKIVFLTYNADKYYFQKIHVISKLPTW